jgi:predicted methyltransferase
VKPDQTLLEITPGGGWYTEILAPLEREHGHFVAIVPDPAYDTDPRAKDADTKQIANLDSLRTAHPDVYSKAEIRRVASRKEPVLGPAGSADAVVTFRNVHNWVMAGDQAAMFKAFFDVLKPGGVLGVTDHRAKPGPATDGMLGYLTEQQVIGYATAAGFVLEEKSEINANPKDTKDYTHGVWTLPPTLSQGNHGIGTYARIGESDRMTLRFRKPGG